MNQTYIGVYHANDFQKYAQFSSSLGFVLALFNALLLTFNFPLSARRRACLRSHLKQFSRRETRADRN